MQPAFLEPRPPHISFESRAVERRKTAEEGGSVYYVEQDYIIITPAGSKDRVERIWSEYENYLLQLTKSEQFPRKWLDDYRLSYKEWKAGNELPLNGTPIRNWPVPTSAEVKILLKAGVHTVEDLAAANEATIGFIGMGGRSLKQRAVDYLTARSDTTPLVQQLDALRATNAGLEHRVTTLMKQVAALSAQIGARQPAEVPADDPFVRTAPPVEDAAEGVDESIDDALLELQGRETDEEP